MKQLLIMLFFFPMLNPGMRYPIALKHLFEISTGVLDNGTSYYYVDDAGEKKPLRMLRMGMFNPITKEISLDEDRAGKSEIKKETKAKKKQSVKEKIIGREKLLTPDDYLICTRVNKNGSISCYSLQNSSFDLMPELFGPSVISHHFIFLRPRTDIGHLHVPFMHLLLDALIKLKLAPENTEPRKGNTKDIAKNILTKKGLENLVVNYPVSPEEQKNIYTNYQKHKADKLKAEEQMIMLEGQLVDDFENLNKL